MRKKRMTEEHDNTDRWVVSYADFITLLFAFFTTMYAISHVDIGKLEKFSGSMKSAFRATGTDEKRTAIIEGIRPVNYDDVRIEKDLKSVYEKFDRTEGIDIKRDERGVTISFGDSVLFETGSPDINPDARRLLSSVEPIMRKTGNQIIIEGHTDNVPIKGRRYPSNWELSVARATGVLVYYLREHKLDPSRFSAAGYGEFKPVASNSDPAGRARNRRVDIIFVSRKDGQ
jgi:chemotaxis protein MotB